MPTAAEHRGEAIALQYSIDGMAGIRAQLVAERDDLGIEGGTVTPLLVRAADASIANLDHIGRHCTSLIDELYRRAALCDQYTQAVRTYESLHETWRGKVDRYHELRADHLRARWPGDEPLPPDPPFTGAVAG